MTATVVSEVAFDDTAPGELVLVNTDTDTTDKPNPLAFFLIFVPFIYLGAIAIILTTKLIKWGLQKASDNQTNAPVAAAYDQIKEI